MTDDEWKPIEFPPNMLEMLEKWRDSTEPNVGWCLLCDRPIRSAEDLLPMTSTHNCELGRKLIRAGMLARRHGE
jgi:hypothetical protein